MSKLLQVPIEYNERVGGTISLQGSFRCSPSTMNNSEIKEYLSGLTFCFLWKFLPALDRTLKINIFSCILEKIRGGDYTKFKKIRKSQKKIMFFFERERFPLFDPSEFGWGVNLRIHSSKPITYAGPLPIEEENTEVGNFQKDKKTITFASTLSLSIQAVDSTHLFSYNIKESTAIDKENKTSKDIFKGYEKCVEGMSPDTLIEDLMQTCYKSKRRTFQWSLFK